MSDRRIGGMIGAGFLARAFGEALSVAPEYLGSPSVPPTRRWDADLNAARPLIASAAGFVERNLTAGRFPILCMSKCSTSIGTLPVVAQLRPDATVVWFDAHGEFNTPESTTTGYLGGMPVAGACGYWDTGFAGTIPPERIVFVGGRDFDPPEVRLMKVAGVGMVAPGPECASTVLELLGNGAVYLHVDWDVLEPGYIPTEYRADGGLMPDDLRDILAAVVTNRDVVGLELAELDAPDEGAATRAVVHACLEILEPVMQQLRTS